MDSLDFQRSKSLNIVPKRKVDSIIESIRSSKDDIKTQSILINAINKYAESNIPIEYWKLSMDKHYEGDQRLLTMYKEYTSDLKKAFLNGESFCLCGSHGRGKMISLQTELPTPNGFIKLIDLKEGDQLFDEEGKICNVTKLHPIDLAPESYRLTFDDGNTVDACADHLWQVWSRTDRVKESGPTVKNTKYIFDNQKFPNGIRKAANFSIKNAKPISYAKKDLIIDPYVLGCWLGDGSSNNGQITTMDQEILDEINKAGYSTNLIPSTVRKNNKACNYRVGDLVQENDSGSWYGRLALELKSLNMIKNKHIPEEYLYSSYEDRLALLQGLLDTDGCCDKSGKVEYCSVLPMLANQVSQLVKSLGIKTKVKVNKSFLYGARKKDRYRVVFCTKLPVFRLNRKLANIRLEKNQLSRTEHRFIISVEKIDPVPMRCITVDSASHLFLITRDYIATHNTMMSACVLKEAALKNYTCLYTTLSDIVNVLLLASSEEKFLARRELTLVDFLVIDEFDSRFMPTESASDLYARSLEGIFRTRVQNHLPTLMATNSPNILNALSGPMQQSMGSLMKGYLKMFPVLGSDFREKKSQ